MRRREYLTFRISGQAMDIISGSDLYEQPDRYDLGNKAVKEASQALQCADEIRCGKGRSYAVMVSPLAAEEIRHYCDTVGRTLKVQLETRRDGDALLVVSDRIFWKLKEMGKQ